MHLRDRRRRHRPLVERDEQLIQRLLEIRLDHRFGLRRGERRQTVLQLGQVARDRLTEQVAAHRQGLAELDEDGPELLQGPGQALARAPGRILVGDPLGHPCQHRRHGQEC